MINIGQQLPEMQAKRHSFFSLFMVTTDLSHFAKPACRQAGLRRDTVGSFFISSGKVGLCRQVREVKESNCGFGLIETITAVGLFAIFATVGVTTVLHSYSVNRLSEEKDQAVLLAQEGIEATRSLKEQDWTNIVAGTYGLDESGGSWAFSGSSDTTGDYTRSVTVSTVQRDGSDDIVTSGGTVDTDTMLATSTVTWSFTPTRNNTVTLSTYLTNYVKAIGGSSWGSPSQESSLDISGNDNGWKVDTSGNYAYIVRQGGNPSFIIVDVSNTASPSQVGSLNVSGNPRDVHVIGDYAYLATTGTEFEVVNVSAPAVPVTVGSYNPSGNANGNGVYVVGSNAYLVRDSSSQDEFLSINVSIPAVPTLSDSLNLGTTANEVWVSGNYAYVATDGTELMVIDVSNPSSVSQVGSLDLSGGDNGETITGFGSVVALGRAGGGEVAFIDVSTPTSPSLLGSVSIGDDVRDVDFDTTGDYLFVGTDLNSGEFTVIDSSNTSSPSVLGSVNVGGDINGVSYSETVDRVVGVGDSNSEEVIIFQP